MALHDRRCVTAGGWIGRGRGVRHETRTRTHTHTHTRTRTRAHTPLAMLPNAPNHFARPRARHARRVRTRGGCRGRWSRLVHRCRAVPCRYNSNELATEAGAAVVQLERVGQSFVCSWFLVPCPCVPLLLASCSPLLASCASGRRTPDPPCCHPPAHQTTTGHTHHATWLAFFTLLTWHAAVGNMFTTRVLPCGPRGGA